MKDRRRSPRQIRGDFTPRDSPQSVSTKGIKDFVSKHLPRQHPLREVILLEKDTLTPEEVLAKMEVWMVLLDHRV
jgi:hypothetical protein